MSESLPLLSAAPKSERGDLNAASVHKTNPDTQVIESPRNPLVGDFRPPPPVVVAGSGGSTELQPTAQLPHNDDRVASQTTQHPKLSHQGHKSMDPCATTESSSPLKELLKITEQTLAESGSKDWKSQHADAALPRSREPYSYMRLDTPDVRNAQQQEQYRHSGQLLDEDQAFDAQKEGSNDVRHCERAGFTIPLDSLGYTSRPRTMQTSAFDGIENTYPYQLTGGWEGEEAESRRLEEEQAQMFDEPHSQICCGPSLEEDLFTGFWRPHLL